MLNGHGFSSGVQLLNLWKSGGENKAKTKLVGFLAAKKPTDKDQKIDGKNAKETKTNPISLVKNLKEFPKTIIANKMSFSTREPNKIGLESIKSDSSKLQLSVSVSEINVDKRPVRINAEEDFKKPTKPETVPFSKLIERKTVRTNQSNKIFPQSSNEQSESENLNSKLIKETNKIDINDAQRPVSSKSNETS
jgi:hypothetical protein